MTACVCLRNAVYAHGLTNRQNLDWTQKRLTAIRHLWNIAHQVRELTNILGQFETSGSCSRFNSSTHTGCKASTLGVAVHWWLNSIDQAHGTR